MKVEGTPVSEIRPSSNAVSGTGSLSPASRRAAFAEFEESDHANRRRYCWPVVDAIIRPWPYLRVIRRSSLILKVEQTSFAKPHAACFELVGSANQLHAPLGWAFPTLGRFEDLTDAPADVSFDFDTLRKHCLRSQHRGGIVTRELRIQ